MDLDEYWFSNLAHYGLRMNIWISFWHEEEDAGALWKTCLTCYWPLRILAFWGNLVGPLRGLKGPLGGLKVPLRGLKGPFKGSFLKGPLRGLT